MAPTGRRIGRTRAQRRGGQTELTAVTESEAPGPTETLAGLETNVPSQPNYSPQHGQQPPLPSPHVQTTPPSIHSCRHQDDPADLNDENPFASTPERNTSHSQPQPILGGSLASADDVEIFNFDTLSDSSGPTTPTPILRPSAPTPKSNCQRRRAK
ncbi:hypothetical protein ARMSODRAFT_1021268 [Armillaria solidipes]|uniref:Uncharacterized protein n=1 Tax=Armillaria solidipes TaxID=1076256 RepID=A0A2H3B6G0_9AGAR|nr:hypothetical protein ARMSODRAFT_1021268 [Armillaria solidipes]